MWTAFNPFASTLLAIVGSIILGGATALLATLMNEIEKLYFSKDEEDMPE